SHCVEEELPTVRCPPPTAHCPPEGRLTRGTACCVALPSRAARTLAPSARVTSRSWRKRTSCLVGWTLTSTICGGTVTATTAEGCRPTISRLWYASSSAYIMPRCCTQRPLTKKMISERSARSCDGCE